MTDRGVSTVVSYVLVLGIVALLSVGLVVSMAGMLDQHRGDASTSSLEVVGHAIADDLATADRLATAGNETETVEVYSDLPEEVADRSYSIAIEGDEVHLWTHDGEATATVTIRTSTPVEATTVAGGSLRIAYNESDGWLVISGD